MSHAETMCTFSLVFFCILQICKGRVADGQTHTRTHGQSLLEDASRIKNAMKGIQTRRRKVSLRQQERF